MTYYANYHVPKAKTLACEQALCLGKNSDEREGKGGRGEGGGGGGWRERAFRQTVEAAILPSCNYRAEHLSLTSLTVNRFRA